MIIELTPYSDKPIYEQLILEIKRGIVMGELQPGEALPSVRALAADIGINMHTVNKVYKYLQQENVLLKQKSGFIVNPEPIIPLTQQKKEAIRQLLYELLMEKELYNITDANFLEEIKEVQQELRK